MVTRPGNPDAENSPLPGGAPRGEFWVPGLLVEWTPFWRSFSGGVRGLFEKPPAPEPLLYPPADFWPDSLVADWFPRIGLLRSMASHILFVGLVFLLHLVIARQFAKPQLRATGDFSHYELSPYLPPVRSASAPAKRTQKGKPALAPQPITSTPQEPDNTEQTVVLPNQMRSARTLPLPNMVALDVQPVPPTPELPNLGSARSITAPPDLVVAPPPELARLRSQRAIPAMDQPAPVPPTPELKATTSRPKLELPSDIVAPPPELKALSTRQARALPTESVVPPPPDASKLARGAMNLAPTLLAETPKLAVQPQQAAAPPTPTAGQGNSNGQGTTAAAAKAAPNAAAGGGTPTPAGGTPPAGAQAAGSPVIALSLHPEPGSKTPPEGNRRGTFSASPSGSPNAPGTPELHASPNGKEAGAGTSGSANAGAGDSTANARNIPSGIHVGAPPAGVPTSPQAGTGKVDFKSLTPSVRQTIAAASLPPARAAKPQEAEPEDESKVPANVRHFFPGRRTYTMAVNSPNLNSAGGSWVFHFAELKGAEGAGKVLAPGVVVKSDPKYPSELQRRRLEGLVTLFAVIHTDGHVSDVRIVDGVFPDLDEFAREALERWQFLPAQKNGSPIAVETLVTVPFKARREF